MPIQCQKETLTISAFHVVTICWLEGKGSQLKVCKTYLQMWPRSLRVSLMRNWSESHPLPGIKIGETCGNWSFVMYGKNILKIWGGAEPSERSSWAGAAFWEPQDMDILNKGKRLHSYRRVIVLLRTFWEKLRTIVLFDNRPSNAIVYFDDIQPTCRSISWITNSNRHSCWSSPMLSSSR